MTLNEIAYMILEGIRSNYISDDERIDIRLIKDWIHLKRAQYIKNQRSNNPNNRLNLNLYQSINITTEIVTASEAGTYPYSTPVEDTQIIVSTETIPTIIEDKEGPVIYSIESNDLVKFPFSVVDYDYMRFAGNGKFNKNLIFASIRDNKIYFKYNDYFETYNNVVIKAIFEDPTEVPDYDDETSTYPANLGLLEYIKNAVFEIDLRVITSVKADEINDSTGEIKI